MPNPFYATVTYPWHRADAQAVHGVLSQTITSYAQILNRYRRCAGDNPPGLPTSGTPEELWQAVLEKLYVAQRLDALWQQILGDGSIINCHPAVQTITAAGPQTQPIDPLSGPKGKQEDIPPSAFWLAGLFAVLLCTVAVVWILHDNEHGNRAPDAPPRPIDASTVDASREPPPPPPPPMPIDAPPDAPPDAPRDPPIDAAAKPAVCHTQTIIATTQCDPRGCGQGGCRYDQERLRNYRAANPTSHCDVVCGRAAVDGGP